MNFKYSVIIPVYNAEKTLNRCVDSLINQNFKDAEIILINDGSNDNSGQICKDYSCKFSQIKYIEKQNSGVSSARNLGLRLATGTYIMFVDSDDYVAENYFITIDNEIAKEVSDLLLFSHFKIRNNIITEVKYSPFFSEKYENVVEKLSDLICRKIINAPWGKVYKREIIEKNKVDFTAGVEIGEDRAFNIKYALNVKSVKVIKNPLYYVNLENTNSLSRKKILNFDEQLRVLEEDVSAVVKKCKLADEYKQVFVNALNFGQCRLIYKKAKDLHRDNIPWCTRIKTIKKECKKINKNKLTYPETRYCRVLTLPVRWELAYIIDIMAWKLTH